MRFPAPLVDEAWNVVRAWGFVETGRQFDPLDIGVFDRFDGYWTFLPWLATALQAISLKITNQPLLQPLRFVSLLFGLILLISIFFIADRFGGRKLGLLSVALTAFCWPFLYSGHLARPVMMAAALGFAALALQINNQRQIVWPAFVAGLLVMLSFEIHAHGAIFGPVLTILFPLELGWRFIKVRSFWGVAAGAAVGALFYAALHIFPYPNTFMALNQLAFSSTLIPPLFTLDIVVILQGFRDLLTMLYAVYQPALLLAIWAAFQLSRHAVSKYNGLLIITGTLLLTHAFFIRTKFLYYAILITPLIDIVLAAYILQFIQQPWKGRIRGYILHTFTWGLLIGSIALNLSVLKTDYGKIYSETQVKIDAYIQPEDTIMASQVYWLGLPENPYYSWEQLIYFLRYAPQSSLADGLQEFRPDILIVDYFFGNFILSPVQKTNLYTEQLSISWPELFAFLDQHAEQMTELDAEYYGPIQIYRFQWAE